VVTTPARGVGRPRVSSRETIAEAACELFLESGYEGTSIAGIAQRAGVSRSSFFNYFSSKSDVLWSGFDERLDRAVAALAAPGAGADSAGIEAVLAAILEGLEPDPLALAFGNAQAMGLAEELQRESARAGSPPRCRRPRAARVWSASGRTCSAPPTPSSCCRRCGSGPRAARVTDRRWRSCSTRYRASQICTGADAPRIGDPLA